MSIFIQYAKLRMVLLAGLTLGIGWLALSGYLGPFAHTTQAIKPNATITPSESSQPRFRIRLRDGVGGNEAAARQQELESNHASPLALSSADLDEDGMPDLVSGYRSAGGGFITLHRGNITAIYPHSPEAQQLQARGEFTDAPFLAPARTFAVPEPPDFIGTGDFDADGHWDVVTATRGSNHLYLLRGDGHGGLEPARAMTLAGRVTALTTGEINRADGLTDVIVGIVGEQGAQALVFEGPDGALKAQPEVFPLPAAATALALGQLDDSYERDLAVAAGQNLIVIQGRDRKLSLDATQQAEVAAAAISQTAFPFEITSLAIGDFTGHAQAQIALLATDGTVHLASGSQPPGANNQTSGRAAKWQSQALTAGAWPQAAGLVCAHISGSPADDLVVLDRGHHQLHIVGRGASGQSQAAIQQATAPLTTLELEGEPVAVLPMRLNADALSDLAILSSGQSAPMAAVTEAVQTFTVTNTNDSGAGSLRQAITDANANPGADTITFSIGSGAKTINLALSLPTISDPVTIDGTTQPGFAGSPLIEINGANAGSGAIGLHLNISNITARGLVINHFALYGILLNSDGIIEGNFVGLDLTGNTPSGIGIVSLAIGNNNNTIGGTTAAARNVIVGISSTSRGHYLIQGNFIGINAAGTAKLNLGGIHLTDTSNTTIGGTLAGARNVISGAGSNGGIILDSIHSSSPGGGNLVQGNFIGTNPAANTAFALGNAGGGISMVTTINNTIGGTTVNARNIISGNGSYGIALKSQFNNPVQANNLVQGNYIGTDLTGTKAINNQGPGIYTLEFGSTIGGVVSGARNVISGNSGNGISIDSICCFVGDQIQGNFIGTDANGTAPLSNGGNGVYLFNNSSTQTIGGTTSGAGNIIAFNGAAGVSVNSGNNNSILSNSIFSNGGPGIELIGTANNQAKAPVLTSVTATTIQGTLNSLPSATFRIEFFSNSTCDPSGFGEGQTFIGFTNATTDSSGKASFSFTPAAPFSQLVTATATGPENSTSAFSYCGVVADLAITKSHIGNFAVSANGTYTLRVSNVGPVSSTGTITVIDTLPAGLSFISGTGTGWNCSALGQIVTCTNPTSLAPGANSTISLTVGVASAAMPSVTNSASVSNANAVNPSNNTATDLTIVGPACIYSISPTSRTFMDAGGSGTIGVGFPSGCPWTATSNANWITITNIDTAQGIVSYSVATNTDPKSRTGTITAAGQTLTITQAKLTVSVSGASYAGNVGLAPESIVTAFGSGMATTSQAASSVPLPTSLAGTTVKVKDVLNGERLAPLFYVSPGQINYLVPQGTTEVGTASITITSGDGSISLGTAQVSRAAPGLFAANSTGQGVAAAIAFRVKDDGRTQSYESIAQFDAQQNKFVSIPLDLGPATDQVFLFLYGTGIRNGSGSAQIGGVPVELLYSGPQGGFVGLDQVNFMVPRSLIGRGEVDIMMTVDGKPSNVVKVNIK